MSEVTNKDFILTDYARRLIRFKARQLCELKCFRRFELEDLQQELWLAVTLQADKFDPTRASLNTFIDRVVDSAVKMLLRERQREKRIPGYLAFSLDEPVFDQNAEFLTTEIGTEDLERCTGIAVHDPLAELERNEAVASALAAMPLELRVACQLLMDDEPQFPSAAQGISRRQERKVLQQIRVYLEQAGLDA